jgi:hypothetical protein
LWLQWDLELKVVISYDGKTVGLVIITDDSSNTCFTEGHLI